VISSESQTPLCLCSVLQELRPDTIRGRYGVDRPRSAVHCTDLPQDGTPECEYCFRVMV
jgi:nucleoside-diphosphate kinase